MEDLSERKFEPTELKRVGRVKMCGRGMGVILKESVWDVRTERP